ncbi:MAG: prepilin-type N-terminal cleavage/methylation domain-containing protein, partial [Candidatus Gastranaerophilales bacterium]|nr:prepilin-type N-terminal cleavage/methylation domain-containing protein [Candidatus Gastranaerophilales bacterium]
NIMKKKQGFTLSEVLVVIAIIGIIASITLPTVLSGTNQAENIVKWKKVYANLTQVTLLIIQENGDFKGILATGQNEELKNLYMEHFNYIKSCPNVIADDCWPGTVNLGGTPLMDSLSDNAGFIAADGTIYTFDYERSACSLQLSTLTNPYCGIISVDINGNKGPNEEGKDIFGVYIFQNGLKPYGFEDEVPCENNIGLGCSAKYLYQ